MHITRPRVLYFFLSLFCTLHIACDRPSDTSGSALTFYKSFHGTMGDNSPITMHLRRDSTHIEGYYLYDFIGIPLSIQGEINEEGEMTLSELGPYLKENGTAQAHYDSSAQTIDGTWKNKRIEKDFDLHLELLTDKTIPLRWERSRQHKIDPYSGVMDSSHIQITCARIHGGLPKKIRTQIEEAMEKTLYPADIYRKQYSDVQAFLSSIQQVRKDDYVGIDIDCRVLTNRKPLLALSVRHRIETKRNAHPVSLVYYYNYDTRKGTEIALNDLLLPQTRDGLNRLAEEIFTRTYGRKGWYFKTGEFTLNENFALTQGGFLFLFNPYEIGPYASFPTQLFIPYKDAEAFLYKHKLREFIPNIEMHE